MLSPASVSVPVPDLVSPPVPLITPSKLVLLLSPPVARFAPSRTSAPEPAIEPTVSVAPLGRRISCAPMATLTALASPSACPPSAMRMPSSTFVAPLALLVPLMMSVPVPVLARSPRPVIAPVRVSVLLSSTSKVPPPTPAAGVSETALA